MIHVLLTRTPLYSQDCSCFLVRLACVKRAASVDSEPGSNSRLNLLARDRPWACPTWQETGKPAPYRFVSRLSLNSSLLTNFYYYEHAKTLCARRVHLSRPTR